MDRPRCGTGADERGLGPGPPRPARQISDVQALHFVASTALASLQKGHAFDGAGGASLMKDRAIMKTTNATMMKTMIVLMNVP